MAYDQANTYETIELFGLTEKDAHLPIPEDHILKDSIIRETFETLLGQLRGTGLEAEIEPLAHGLATILQRRNTRKAAGFLGDADDELLDVLGGVAEHLRTAGIGVDVGIAIEDALQGFQLLPFDLGNQFAHGQLIGLKGQVCFAVAGLDDVTRGQPTVIGRHTLGQGETGQQAKREDMRQARLQCRPPGRQGA